MGRRRLMLTVAAILAAAVAAAVPFSLAGHRAASAMPDCPDRPVIVIDPGHGGIDGGANVPGLLEKEVVLDVALRTRAHLERLEVPVLLTRNADMDLGGRYDSGRLRRDLNQRIRMANHCQTVLVLSLHVNSARDTTERGVLIFYQGSRHARDAAYVVDRALRPVHQRRERPHPRPDLAVLRWSKAPSLLVEMGFLSNPGDRALLADATYREQLAAAIAAACASIYQNWIN